MKEISSIEELAAYGGKGKTPFIGKLGHEVNSLSGVVLSRCDTPYEVPVGRFNALLELSYVSAEETFILSKIGQSKATMRGGELDNFD